jgi:cold shock CspA family protein
VFLKSSFGFIQCSKPPLRAYFELDDVEMSVESLSIGAPVSFELGFNLRGPVAKKVRLTAA